jgi:hypothetical protein
MIFTKNILLVRHVATVFCMMQLYRKFVVE